jgi:hypothetical protein
MCVGLSTWYINDHTSRAGQICDKQVKSTGSFDMLKSTIFWDITPCSQLRVIRRFRGTYCLHLQGRKISRARNQHESRRRYVPPKCWLTLNGLLGLISQKEDDTLHNHHCENLKSYIWYVVLKELSCWALMELKRETIQWNMPTTNVTKMSSVQNVLYYSFTSLCRYLAISSYEIRINVNGIRVSKRLGREGMNAAAKMLTKI